MEHARPLLIASLALISIALVGCSDYQLTRVPDLTDGPVSTLSQRPNPIEEPTLGGASSGTLPSAWAALEPGEMPEEFFAVAWSDPGEVENNCYGPCPGVPRYDIIDVMGQVVSSFESPCTNLFAQHHSLQAAGPGRFLAVTSGHSPDSPYNQHVWLGDGISGESEVIMQWGWGTKVYLPQADAEVELPGLMNQARVLVDPQDEDRFFVLISNSMMYAQPLLGTLFSINVRDPDAEVMMWPAHTMITPDMVPSWGHAPWAPWLVDTFQRGDETMLVLGLQVQDEEGELRTVLTGFSPQRGPMTWRMDLSGLHQSGELNMLPPTSLSDARVLFHQGNDGWCPQANFSRFDGETLHSFSGSEELFCSRLGPILDDRADTFVYFGYIDDQGLERQQRAFVNHRGVDVWELSTFRDGLQSVPFEIHGMTRMELPKE